MNFAEWFKLNTPARQATLALVLCVLIAGALLAAYLGLRPHYDVLFSGLRDADAATIVAELDKEKAPYKLQDGGSTILMPADLVAKTRLNLMSSSLPLKGTVGFELFNKSDMGLTEFAQQINYQRALQGELSRTIMAMDGVDEARIHLALPEHAIFRDEAKPPKASVTVLTRPGRALASNTVLGIRRLVAAAVPDLDIANVVVLDGKGVVVSDLDAPQTPSAASGDRSRAAESALETAIRAALRSRFPGRQIDLAVWAGAQDAAGDALKTPDGRRAFPVHVAITVSPPSSPGEEQAIRKVVSTVIDADPNRDVISYAVSTPPPGQAPEPKRPARAAPALPTWAVSFGLGLLIIAIVAVVLVANRRPGGRRLSSRQRMDYAERLRAALDGGPVDGAA